MNKIQDIDVKNKNVLLRVDFNVPMKQSPTIVSDKRIKEALPTIEYLLDKGVKSIKIITHLGKPKGSIDNKYSLWPIANRLAELLSIDVKFDQPADEYQITDNLTMWENLRFSIGEEKNDPEFAKELTRGMDIFCNDAFGTCHRAHTSTVGVAEILPSYAGLLVQKEVEHLNKLLGSYEKPFTVILGGAKIADKLPVVKNLISWADNFLIGGAIASTFLEARRHYLGKSLVEKDSFRQANIIWQEIMDEPDKNIYLPLDLVFSKSAEKPVEVETIETKNLLEPNRVESRMAVDIGPKTIEEYCGIISKSKTLFWNGNMGVSEVKEFAEGTEAIAKAIVQSDVQAVIGGGDTVAAVEELGITSENIFLSTGGGATLEYLSGKQLPGLKVLEK